MPPPAPEIAPSNVRALALTVMVRAAAPRPTFPDPRSRLFVPVKVKLELIVIALFWELVIAPPLALSMTAALLLMRNVLAVPPSAEALLIFKVAAPNVRPLVNVL